MASTTRTGPRCVHGHERGSVEVLDRLALGRMLGGLSTRRYPDRLVPVGTQVAQTASATSKSAVSRRFVAMTHTALADMLAALPAEAAGAVTRPCEDQEVEAA